ncbi:MAG TPA: hypothetical protein VFN68_14850 [Acidimicrobiales bacterium]|nr:hypothetical protein [Acidimicrobiales bacterium]
MIRRRGRSHRATCGCGWSGHAWNDLRPAEADAWEHVYGTDRIVDASAIPGPGDEAAGFPASTPGEGGAEPGRTVAAADALARRARELAGSPSPYARQGPVELWTLAGQDRAAVAAAISEVSELLAAHSRRSAGTADGEWLELITAKRLLEESLREAGVGSYSP